MGFVDPMAEQGAAAPDPERPGVLPELGSDLPALLEQWGLELTTDKVVGDPASAVRVSFRSPRGPREVEYLPWLQLQGDTLNRDDFITNELNVVNVGTAGALDSREGNTLTHVPLIETGKGSGLIERDAVIFVKDPAGLLDNFTADDATHAPCLDLFTTENSQFETRRLGDLSRQGFKAFRCTHVSWLIGQRAGEIDAVSDMLTGTDNVVATIGAIDGDRRDGRLRCILWWCL